MIKTGILGTSETADLFAETLIESGGFELTGCFSPDGKNGNFASRYNLIAYPSAEALFNYTDALIVTDFTPDFLVNTEKAIKNFKHILITNPFLAGLEEIQYLRKLSEESGVLMQLAGGFKFQDIVQAMESKCSVLADLKHVFAPCSRYNGKYMEHMLCDISLLLILLKGIPKKSHINYWNINERENDVVSLRLEMDNGNVANLLLSHFKAHQDYKLEIYDTAGLSVFQLNNSLAESHHKATVLNELRHLELSIKNRYTSTVHTDTMFQALELAHKVKAKTYQNFAVNSPS